MYTPGQKEVVERDWLLSPVTGEQENRWRCIRSTAVFSTQKHLRMIPTLVCLIHKDIPCFIGEIHVDWLPLSRGSWSCRLNIAVQIATLRTIPKAGDQANLFRNKARQQ